MDKGVWWVIVQRVRHDLATNNIFGATWPLMGPHIDVSQRKKKGERENFPAKGSNVQTGLLTQQRIERIPNRLLPPPEA